MFEETTLNMLLGLIAIGQFVAGIFFWYCGVQVKMLRLELVSKKDCETYRDRFREEANAMHTCVSGCKSDLRKLVEAINKARSGHDA